MPSALRNDFERIHDFTTSLETELPQSATRVYVLYKLNSAYIRADGSESRPGLDGRWDVQVSQGLPFMNFMSAEWEMLVGRSQSLPGVVYRNVDLRRTARRPPAEAPRRRHHGQVLKPPRSLPCHTDIWIDPPNVWIRATVASSR